MIELEGLQKVVDQITVIEIDDLRVPSGEIAGLVGPVDSGKDTLFDLLIGRSNPASLGTLGGAGGDHPIRFPGDRAVGRGPGASGSRDRYLLAALCDGGVESSTIGPVTSPPVSFPHPCSRP